VATFRWKTPNRPEIGRRKMRPLATANCAFAACEEPFSPRRPAVKPDKSRRALLRTAARDPQGTAESAVKAIVDAFVPLSIQRPTVSDAAAMPND